MSKMIQLRNVPDSLHRQLKARAALAGMALSDFPLIVVDASTVLELPLRTDKGIRVQERVLDSEESLHAPHLIDIEVTQTLRRLVILEEITAARGKQALEDYVALKIKRAEQKDLLERIWTLRDSITAYDAAYGVLAEILDCPLITCDGKLTRSHGHKARIELID